VSDVDELKTREGRTEVRSDLLAPAKARGMLALLDRNPSSADEGDVLPPGWHWLYFNPAVPRSELAPDGHEERGRFLPPVPLPRRMWAGGRLRFERPLTIGRRVRRRSVIESIEPGYVTEWVNGLHSLQEALAAPEVVEEEDEDG
jgi:3-methylfumaryl-CoA hydratase